MSKRRWGREAVSAPSNSLPSLTLSLRMKLQYRNGPLGSPHSSLLLMWPYRESVSVGQRTCAHTNTRRYQSCGITRMFCKFANSVQAVYKWLRQRFRGNRSRGIQTHWSADTQAFVVSGWEKEKHPPAQAAFIPVTNFQRVCKEQHCTGQPFAFD